MKGFGSFLFERLLVIFCCIVVESDFVFSNGFGFFYFGFFFNGNFEEVEGDGYMIEEFLVDVFM